MKNKQYFYFRKVCFVLALILAQCLYAQNKTITGMVTDSKQEPLIGVNVMLKGSSATGTITDIDGNYTLSVPLGKVVLVYSYIGYVSQEVTVGQQSAINVVLREDAQALDEVIVIGYGTVKKRDLVGSIASVKSQDITAVPTSNVLESMQGKIAGLDMTRSSGQPGSGFNFTIRGNRSLRGDNSPLILVDGIDYGADININPNDVESIEVLKDASTTAIYGSRGANGVILITTKKGKAGKVTVDLNAYWGPSLETNLPKMQNTQQYIAFRREAYRAAGVWNSPADDANFIDPESLRRIADNVYTDWFDLIMDDATTQNYSLSISGGGEKTRASFSLDYFNEDGILVGEDFSRYNGRLSVTQQISKSMEAGASATFMSSTLNNGASGNYHQATFQVPYGIPYNEDGTLRKYPFTGDGSTQINMLFDQDPNNYLDETKATRFFGTAYLNWEIIKGLTFRTNFGIDSYASRNGHFEGVNSSFVGRNSNMARVSKTEYHGNKWTWDNTLTYTRDFGIHSLTAMVGHSMWKSVAEDTYAEGKGLAFEQALFHNLDGTSSEYKLASTLTEQSMLSYFARINYKLMDKYLLTATLRTDGASVLAKGHKWSYFPSVAVAWRMKDEAFLKEVDVVSDLKLRLSYGVSGSSAVRAYQTTGGLDRSMYEFGTSAAYGYRPYGMANPTLGWENTAVFNVGVDYGMFNNRVYLTLDAYKTRTSDLLMSMVLPGHTGFTQVISNIGKTETQGIDLSINTVNFDTKDFKWTTDFTFSANKEKIVELSLGDKQDDVGSGWFIGHPISVIYDFEKIGIWQTADAATAAEYGYEPGDIRVKDQDGDGSIDANEDRRVLGQRTPKWTAGMNNRFEFKGWDFSFFLYTRVGHLISNQAKGSFSPTGWQNSVVCDYWTPENPSNAYPRPNFNKPQMLYTSTLAYEKGDFLKIKDVTLGYSFPKAWISKAHLSKLRLYTTLKNFFTFSHSDNYDPERGGANSYPMTKQIVFGANVSF
ncbi:SusC/RagA family TonB-linked outer membrane protein [Bacteroides sp. UBA939]|uniref:SusC/RagA family TonB-linked outer membrane protein n=1 Tax=Bacteroides sp. UBA939 TaxID=1946092 RepID=UPI0025C34D78|nr:TonB-dependent receptor [Bacteroides sp. UBA939]